MPTRAEKHQMFQKLAVEIIEEFDGGSIEVPRDGDNDYILTPQYYLDTLLEKARAYDDMMTSPEEAQAKEQRALEKFEALQAESEKAGRS